MAEEPPAEEVNAGGSGKLPPAISGQQLSLPGNPAKGSLHTRKSTSMLHDLQDYIKGVEAVANARKEELEKLYEERRDVERKARLNRANSTANETDYNYFANMMDIPTKVRALHEDVKYQKDKLRKYKERTNASERTVITQQQQILKLNDKYKVVSEALATVGKKPRQILDEQEMQKALEAKDKQLEEMEHRLQVVMRSREVDLKRYRLEKSAVKREYEILVAEVNAVKLDNEEKGKSLRMDALKIKTLSKEIEPLRKFVDTEKERRRQSPVRVRASIPQPKTSRISDPFMTSLPDEAHARHYGEGVRVVYDERHVKLMICVVKDDGKVSGNPIKIAAVEESAAATPEEQETSPSTEEPEATSDAPPPKATPEATPKAPPPAE